MKIKFWGVRGSIPSPATSAEIESKISQAIWKARSLPLNKSEDAVYDEEQRSIVQNFLGGLSIFEKGTIGGNTPCVQILPPDNEIIIVDGGSGIRVLGDELMKLEFGGGKGKASILLSHTHWDHICGLPFFVPLFVKGNEFNFYGVHDTLEQRLENQHNPWHFPVPWRALGSKKHFHIVEADKSFTVGTTTIRAHELFHPGKSYSYRFDGADGGVIVYASDAEFKQLQHEKIKEFLEFFHGADILVFDTQYTLTEALAKEDWGHSSAMIGIEMAIEAGVKNLVMFHHEPNYTDEKVLGLCVKADKYQEILNNKRPKCNIHIAYEGLEIDTSVDRGCR